MRQKKVVVITGKGNSSFELRKLLEIIKENPENVEIICEQSNKSLGLTLTKKTIEEYKSKFEKSE